MNYRDDVTNGENLAQNSSIRDGGSDRTIF